MKSLSNISCMCAVMVTVFGMVGGFDQGCVCVQREIGVYSFIKCILLECMYTNLTALAFSKLLT